MPARSRSPTRPGIRVGWGILPAALLKPLLSLKGHLDFGSPHFNQVLMHTVMESGFSSGTCHKVREAYRAKLDATLCRRRVPGADPRRQLVAAPRRAVRVGASAGGHRRRPGRAAVPTGRGRRRVVRAGTVLFSAARAAAQQRVALEFRDPGGGRNPPRHRGLGPRHPPGVVMHIIDRYMFRQFIQVFLICYCSLTGIYVVFGAFTNMESFLRCAKGMQLFKLVACYYGYQSIFFFDRTSGLLTLMSAMFTVTWIQRHNEMTALMAAGISRIRVVMPVIIGAMLIDGFCGGQSRMDHPGFREDCRATPAIRWARGAAPGSPGRRADRRALPRRVHLCRAAADLQTGFPAARGAERLRQALQAATPSINRPRRAGPAAICSAACGNRRTWPTCRRLGWIASRC